MPKDIELTGKSETFTITVNYDTQELYGKVTASRKVTIRKKAKPKEAKEKGTPSK